MLLIFAPLTGCLLLARWAIKNDNVPFNMVGRGYVILLVTGQLAVYLLCKGICGT